jgi:cytochrome P450
MSRATAKRQRFPLGASLMLDQLEVDPYPHLRRLQEKEPISWVEGVGMWFVTRRADVVRVLKDPATFGTDSDRSPIRDIFGSHMLSTDGDERVRYKSRCMPSFTANRVRQTENAAIEMVANDLVDSFAGDGSVDLRVAFAGPLAFQGMAHVMGIPPNDDKRFRGWYEIFTNALANFSGDPAVRRQGSAAASEFRSYVGQCLSGSIAIPEGSLLAELVAQTSGRLSNEEILSNALIILFGGLETTESVILNTLWALLTHPDQFDEVRQNPSLLAPAIEETLRWEPAVQSCTRYVRVATGFHGVDLEQNEIVQCMLGAANRDPSFFADPDRFDIHRINAAEHVSFGVGTHFCLGAPLARLEAEIGLRVLLSRLPDFKLISGREDTPRGYEFRKPPRLHVRWTRP